MTKEEIIGIVKTEYVTKLKKLGCYDKWCTNVEAYRHDKYVLEYMKDVDSFLDLMLSSFNWNNTPEGNEFWKEIANS